jgi:aminomethyltransferase
VTGRRVPREDYAIHRDGDRVGTVTSGTFSPTLQQPIAMGYVTADARERGTALQVDIRGQLVSAEVVELPFYQRRT